MAKGAMSDLPELPDFRARKLLLQWHTHLETYGLTGDHLHWHEQERNRLSRVAPQSVRTRPYWFDTRATDETGIDASVKVAERRFNDLLGTTQN
jgi:hypothetical protein